MAKTFEAVFDGKVFHPDGRIKLTPNKHYILVVREKDEEAASLNAWDILDGLTGTIEAPEDWAVEHDHYLYGVPRKRGKELL
jgi:hypothetical protein